MTASATPPSKHPAPVKPPERRFPHPLCVPSLAKSASNWVERKSGKLPASPSWICLVLLTAIGLGGLTGNRAEAQCPETWSQAAMLTARGNHAMAYDSDRDRVVLFGGQTSDTNLADTWEWNGSSWTLRNHPPAVAPVPRNGAAMAYDPVRQRTVMFGGINLNSADLYGDTWEWNGSQWTLMASTGPAPRGYAGAVFDSARGHVVLFGGFSGSTVFGDTWEWTGSAWSLVTTSGPPARAAHGMAHDTDHARTLVYGGFDGTAALGDTWQLQGGMWTQVLTPAMPPARAIHGLVYDASRGRVVMFGGVTDVNNGIEFGDTWELIWGPNGSTWSQVASGGPAARASLRLVFEAGRSRVLLFGGNTQNDDFADTWSWNGSAWTKLADASAPSDRVDMGMTYDAVRGVSLLFGGSAAMGIPAGDTWTWNGAAWTQHNVPGPSPRANPAIAFDSGRGKVVLCGGYGPNGDPFPVDTWEWNGSAWLQVATTGLPGGSSQATMAYDAAHARSVLFSNTGETWLWSGAIWNQAATTGPAPRRYASMAYDAARGRVVLFGGEDTFQQGLLRGDTWEWNGATWALRATTGPTPRARHTLTYDAARSRVVLFGGFDGSHGLADTWEWTGTAWNPISGSAPGSRFGQGAAYDASRNQLVIFGGAEYLNGNPFFSSLSETWEFGVTSTAPSISEQPVAQSVCPGMSANFTISAAGTAPLAYRWQAYFDGSWSDGDDGDIHHQIPNGPDVIFAHATGTHTPQLTISNAQLDIIGGSMLVRCVVTNACTSVTSSDALLAATTCACSIADITGIGGPPAIPDGLITGDDFNAFIAAFAAGDLLADITGIGGPPEIPDGLITGDDFNAFIAAFAQGCP